MPSHADAIEDVRLEAAVADTKRYEWASAAERYQEVLWDPSKYDIESLSRYTELLANCHFRAAFQSKRRESFRQKMELAKASYERVTSLYESTSSVGLAKMAKARALFADFWLSEESGGRRTLVEKCIELAQEAAASSKNQGNVKELAEAHLSLLEYYLESLHLLVDGRLLAERFKQAVQLGRDTVPEWESIDGGEKLVEALYLTLWMLTVLAQVLVEPREFEALLQETAELESKLSRVSEKIRTPLSKGLSKEISADIALTRSEDILKALALYEESLHEANITRDTLAVGRLLAFMGLVELWRSFGEEYEDRRRDALETGVKRGEGALQNLEVPFHTSFLAAACDAIANCRIDLATTVETEPERRREQLRKAVAVAQNALSFETHTWAWQRVAHSLSKATYFLAASEPDQGPKRKLLEDSLRVREETVRVTDSLSPNSWSAGVMRNYLALIKAEMAKLEKDPGARKKLLTAAVSDMSQCMDMCSKYGFAHDLANYAEWYGDVLFQLFLVSREPSVAEKAIKAYDDSVVQLTRSGLVGQLGPINWKVARVNDSLGDFRQAAEVFMRASEAYKEGAKRVPGLASAFEESAVYMRAWALIEEARVSHIEGEFLSASERYAKAANLLNDTKTWSHIGGLCTSRSVLERGEALSHEEKHRASIHALRAALKSFLETRRELEKRLATRPGSPEEPELKLSLKIAERRELYCEGRIELEEAREHDKKGEKALSAKKYRSASQSFRSLIEKVDSPQDRGELETLAQFCDAWAKMKEADLESSPELYAFAAESFLRVTNPITRGFRLLALANSSICRALEAGTRFRFTRDAQAYSTVKRHLEAAADYYSEAGFKKTEHWTRATKRLFDALVYLSDAEAEKDSQKRSDLYQLAERHLELAAKLYGEAGFPSKKEEATRYLKRARQEKELLLKTMNAIAEIPTATGSSVISPPFTGVQPLGLERFEEANVVGNLTVPEREVRVGSELAFEVEMANVGKNPATLIRVENVVPEGFEIERQKNPYRIEGNSIDMRGKRLEHLKMDELKLVLRPVQKGAFELKPRILFADDKGKYRAHELGPVPLIVTELGLRGWLFGQDKGKAAGEAATRESLPATTARLLPFQPVAPNVQFPEAFRFETERGRDVFHHLVKEFILDYMGRRLYVEKAGWRSLMEVVRETKAPRSALYGPRGQTGPALSELERRGLVETRIFPQERGRGGEITKVRVAYENEIVKRIVEQTVMQNN